MGVLAEELRADLAIGGKILLNINDIGVKLHHVIGGCADCFQSCFEVGKDLLRLLAKISFSYDLSALVGCCLSGDEDEATSGDFDDLRVAWILIESAWIDESHRRIRLLLSAG